MSNDSTAPGYLTPVGDAPEYDEELEREISRWIRGVTGIDAKLVFPRWTDPQSSIPKNGITWVGFGITTNPLPDTPANVQVSEENSEQWTWEQVTVLCCFYGPHGSGMASLFRAGIAVEQNQDTLRQAAGLSLLEFGEIFNLPELINNQWVRRYDITVTLLRKNTRTYNVKSILIPNVEIITGD
ncbi:hypothetical protein CWC46_07880 [Prodigiosinella confusarubida]|uniref:Phage neck terminator protein gp12-like domain-containing protein n=1 Tax=Serratia sp. (strain ATCC 39006) TaxID=104623 RepID=A0A2I5THQ2_SERS3|nr:hypothetical protein [Serratia sp. ATCC 39006]AUG99748.1 hypothetical protein CWC46_07880 [Serratia sp. ATCC 39006]AUH04067.1 hypothetical protein Ser39006_007885 [Serratia sp. ATCC 39006]